MNNYHARVYVGPTLVTPLANKFRAAGITVTVEGTENIHCLLPGATELAAKVLLLDKLRGKYDTAFCLNTADVYIIRRLVHA